MRWWVDRTGGGTVVVGVCAGEALQGPLAAKAVSLTESHVRCCEADKDAAAVAAEAAADAPPLPPPAPASAVAPPATPVFRADAVVEEEESWRVSMLNIFVKSIFRGDEEPKANAPGVLRRLSLQEKEGGGRGGIRGGGRGSDGGREKDGGDGGKGEEE